MSAPIFTAWEGFSEQQAYQASQQEDARCANESFRNGADDGGTKRDGEGTSGSVHRSISMRSATRRRQSDHSDDKRPSTISTRVQPLELVFQNLSFEVQDRVKNKKSKKKDEKKKEKIPAEMKAILNHLDGMFRPGRLTAIMGPSGAGKTSLLDALAGNVMGGVISGQVLVNGEDYTGKKIKNISGFVFQDDVLLETMTVREAIEQSALLRLPKSVSKDERKQRVEDILLLLNLQNCQNTKIGSPLKKGISGGERKRTSIAMELIANPPMLFLDEPTSGLDTFTAYTVVKSLKRLAKQGRTVIATIHQPSSEIFHLFDDLLLLSNGSIVYYGSAKSSVEYFSKLGYACPKYSNPADFYFMEVLRQFEIPGLAEVRRKLNPSLALRIEETEEALLASGSVDEASARINKLISAWETSPEHDQLLKDMESGRKDGVAVGMLRKMAPAWTQFMYLLKRSSKNAFRNPMIVTVNLIKALFLGLLVGLVYLDSNQYSIPIQIRNKSGAIYFLALNQFFGSTFGILSVFYVEKQVFFREYKAGYYTTTPYFFGKFLVELPYNFLFPYLMVIIAYYMVGLNPPFSAYLFSATFVAMASLCGVSLGMLIASIFDDLQVILAVTPIILLPLLILSGIFVSGKSIPAFLIWIKYISPIYYSAIGMLQVEFSRDFPNCDPNVQNCSGANVLSDIGFVASFSSGVNMVMLGVLWIAFTLAAYLILLLTTRRRFKSK